MAPKSNQALVNKADLVVADLASDGGYLPPTSAARFMRIAIDDSVLMSLARVVPLPSLQHRVPKIRFNGRIMRAGSEGTPVAADDRHVPDTDARYVRDRVVRPGSALTDDDAEVAGAAHLWAGTGNQQQGQEKTQDQAHRILTAGIRSSIFARSSRLRLPT